MEEIYSLLRHSVEGQILTYSIQANSFISLRVYVRNLCWQSYTEEEEEAEEEEEEGGFGFPSHLLS
jgi:hypothetical protein